MSWFWQFTTSLLLRRVAIVLDTIQKAQFWETKQRFQNFYFVIGTDVFRLFLGWAAIEGMRNVNIDMFYKWNILKSL